MERFTQGLLEHYGVRAIVGKGGLLDESVHAMRKFGGCYLAIVGGAAALETTQIEAIEEVYWEDPYARMYLEVSC
jgi:L(+)-tartrate dehydratase beta subunit